MKKQAVMRSVYRLGAGVHPDRARRIAKNLGLGFHTRGHHDTAHLTLNGNHIAKGVYWHRPGETPEVAHFTPLPGASGLVVDILHAYKRAKFLDSQTEMGWYVYRLGFLANRPLKWRLEDYKIQRGRL